ncbi:PadR family transcriptional regulator [Colidextribacter sp. OB.20]|uniref:PadR family transcriptional regulator n=1 Tax=Colidextribacter sp. OB.20 TaxID=2304568 RepID=UPI001371D715|nr:helix-turn-helix transcriptional regulator [Colidextribacter sp. OB.20]NBI09460.1 PadR family transcriptional regulator [Colidextribacter sp. OB.20]
MPGREKGPLTEPMYYVLMSFLRREMCGTEVTDFVDRKTKGRVRLGPGTLYTLLARFQDEGMIAETSVDGRKRTYKLTDKGRAAFEEELARLRACVNDGLEEEEAP